VSAATDFRPLDLRLTPELRRCTIYVVIGFMVIAGTVVGLKWMDGQKDKWVATIVFLSVLGAAAGLLVVVAYRYRVRIDHRGVWRRRLVHWDLWPWEAFEQAKVRHGKAGDQLTYPEKPWHWRTISASLLAEPDRTAFETVVRRYRVPPPPPEVPELVAVKYGVRARLELSADGVRLRAHRRDEGELIPWPEVVRAEVIRTTHDRPDFATLELHLPGRPDPVRLTHHKGTPTWSGAAAEVIALYLGRQLDGGRFQVTAQRGPPVDLAEADRRLARLDQIERDLRKASRFIRHVLVWGVLGLAVVMFEPWDRPNPVNWGRADWAALAAAVGLAVAALSLHGVLIFGVAYCQGRELRRQRGDILRWRAEHVAGMAPATS
jgi:hypothetical protein